MGGASLSFHFSLEMGGAGSGGGDWNGVTFVVLQEYCRTSLVGPLIFPHLLFFKLLRNCTSVMLPRFLDVKCTRFLRFNFDYKLDL